MEDMTTTTFTEADHPRAATGQFTHKAHAEAGVSLAPGTGAFAATATAPEMLSPLKTMHNDRAYSLDEVDWSTHAETETIEVGFGRTVRATPITLGASVDGVDTGELMADAFEVPGPVRLRTYSEATGEVRLQALDAAGGVVESTGGDSFPAAAAEMTHLVDLHAGTRAPHRTYDTMTAADVAGASQPDLSETAAAARAALYGNYSVDPAEAEDAYRSTMAALHTRMTGGKYATVNGATAHAATEEAYERLAAEFAAANTGRRYNRKLPQEGRARIIGTTAAIAQCIDWGRPDRDADGPDGSKAAHLVAHLVRGDEYADYQIQLSYLGYGHRDGDRHGTAVQLEKADPRL